MFENIFNQVAQSSAGGGGNRIQDGEYLYRVERLLMEKKFGGTCFIAEFKVEEAKPVFDDVQPNAVGSTCSFVINFDGPGRQSAPSNVKAFVLALLGVNEAETSVGELVETLKELTGPAQPARGMLIRNETYRKYARTGKNSQPDKAGRPPMVMNSWKHVPAEGALKVQTAG